MTAILCICMVIYNLQTLGNIMVTLLGFKTKGHRAGGVTLVLRLRVWPKLPRIGAGAQAVSAAPGQLPGLGDQEVRRPFSDTSSSFKVTRKYIENKC